MKQTRLKMGPTYHIFNRGQIFFEIENYAYFIRLFKKNLLTYVDLIAYCLLPNHYHLLLRINDEKENNQDFEERVTRKFGAFLGSYVKAINNRYRRTGSLFEGRFQRLEVVDDNQLLSTLVYIHQNPQKHGLVPDFRLYPYSSYSDYLTKAPGDLISEELISNPEIYDSIMKLHNVIKDAGS